VPRKWALLQPVDATSVEERIPGADLQDATTIVRLFAAPRGIIFIQAGCVDNPRKPNLDLADPASRVRMHPVPHQFLQQTLLAALVTHHAKKKATKGAGRLLNNMARAPSLVTPTSARSGFGECESLSRTPITLPVAIVPTGRAQREYIKSTWFSLTKKATAHTEACPVPVLQPIAPNRDNAVKFLGLPVLRQRTVLTSLRATTEVTPPLQVWNAESVAKLGEFKAGRGSPTRKWRKNIPAARKNL